MEEEREMAESYKRSLKETLGMTFFGGTCNRTNNKIGLQVESLQMELEVEREKVNRLENEITIKNQSSQIHMLGII